MLGRGMLANNIIRPRCSADKTCVINERRTSAYFCDVCCGAWDEPRPDTKGSIVPRTLPVEYCVGSFNDSLVLEALAMGHDDMINGPNIPLFD